ncbi:MAG: MFS transporter [Myxococcota bacterium]
MADPIEHDDEPRLRRHLYLFSFADEFGPLFALYTLWFADHGITAEQTSVVFALWAAVAIVFEVPSGALADRIDRRVVVASGLGLRAVGITVWLVWPTYAGVLTGAVLWAVHGTLESGAWEALVHDQLAARGRAEAYAQVMARIEQFSHTGSALGIVTALALLHAGVSWAVLGWITVAAHAVPIVLVSRLRATERDPDDDEDDDDDPSSYAAWWATLRSGLDTVRTTPVIARVVVMAGLLEGLFVFDEYVPLLARARGASDASVPLMVLIVWAGVLLGGEVAARRTTMSPRALALLMLAGTGAMFAGVALPHLAALASIGLGYAALQLVWVLSDARLQAQLPGATRATVTSVRALLSGIVSMVAFAVVGQRSPGQDPSAGLLMLIPALVIVGAMVAAWLPAASTTAGDE